MRSRCEGMAIAMEDKPICGGGGDDDGVDDHWRADTVSDVAPGMPTCTARCRVERTTLPAEALLAGQGKLRMFEHTRCLLSSAPQGVGLGHRLNSLDEIRTERGGDLEHAPGNGHRGIAFNYKF